MLEEHNNGKRHRKNLHKTRESTKIAVKPEIEEHKVEKLTAKFENEGSLLPNSAQETEEKKQADAVGGENSNERKQLITGEEHKIDCSDSQRHGMKRKIPDGQGGECTKTLEAARLKVGSCKRTAVIPLIRDLCNVKCVSQVVFDNHIYGRKHAAKLKRFGLETTTTSC